MSGPELLCSLSNLCALYYGVLDCNVFICYIFVHLIRFNLFYRPSFMVKSTVMEIAMAYMPVTTEHRGLIFYSVSPTTDWN